MFEEYVAHGWKLCAIDKGKKAPVYDDWNTKPIPADAVGGLDGAGLLHALSGTCALDIDHMELARPWLAERGIDIDALLEDDHAVTIDSGRPGRAKLLYRMKRPLRTFKPKGSGLELRCATAAGASVQDVLPPTIHPDTKRPYEWGGGLLADWREPQPIPAALLNVWRELVAGGEPEPLPEQIERPRVDLVKLRKAAFRHSPDCEYDEWIKVGMQLHDGTGGAQEGFDIWAEWSANIKRAPYPGEAVLKSHWLSFDSKGKHAASGAALAAELPAEADEFPIVTPEEATPDAQVADRKAQVDALVERFVFVVLNQEYFDTERHALIGDKALKHLLTPYMPRRGGREIDPVDRLMRARAKTSVEAMAFHPGEGPIFTHAGRRYANTFFAEFPEPLEPTAEELERIDWLFNRIEDEAYRSWLKQFFAHIIQHPGIKIRTAPLIWSEIEGNGKSTLAHTIPKLLVGPHYYEEVDQGELNSDFNDYLVGKWVVALTEFRAGTRGERAAISKKAERWIADDTLAVNPKGIRGYSVPNHLVITASTNSDDAAQIGEYNRKWAIYNLLAPAMTEAEKAWLFEGFLRTERAPGVLRHYFLHIPINTFSPNADAIKTGDRLKMIAASSSPDIELLTLAFEEKAEPLSKGVVITREVADYVRRNCSVKPSTERIGKVLCGAPFNGAAFRFRCGKSTYRAVALDHKWINRPGADIMAHIMGEDEDLTA
jgi:hypothetical protein